MRVRKIFTGMGKRVLGIVLSAGLLCLAGGCGSGGNSEDLMRGIDAGSAGTRGADRTNAGEDSSAKAGGSAGGTVSAGGSAGAAPDELSSDSAAVAADFGLRLLRQSFEDGEGNVLLSPLSVLSALTMTANGAKGETLRQMEEVFGLSVPELNQYLSTYRETLQEGETLSGKERCRMSMANAIWFKDVEGFSVEKDFLRTNKDYFDAGVYKAPFDESTKEDINRFVEGKTDGMVKEILDQIDQYVVMYLVNALAFEGEWQTIYKSDQVREGTFTGEDGTARKVELMYSLEDRFLESEQAEGFVKYYAGGNYAFAALLPGEGVKMSEFLASLTGAQLHEMLSEPAETLVYAAVPKFQGEYSDELSRLLREMGIRDAFDGRTADFTGMGTSQGGNLYIGRVLHKTFVAVDEKGTKAGAATAVEMKEEGAVLEPEEIKTVYLDRPFVYLIMDCDENLPIFLGTLMTAGENS